MTMALKHRGPDGHGFYHDDYLSLGHTRLAIVDLSQQATQPMDVGSHIIIFNGEIYNYKSLRQMLIDKGHVFFSHSDTEVLVRLYVEYGKEMLTMLNGMFAFAIYDKKEKQCFLARDRYGIKPLYYHQSQEGDFFFSSEIKGLLASGQIQPNLDHGAMIEYFTFQNFFSQRTLHQNIHLFPQASYAVIDLTSKTKKNH